MIDMQVLVDVNWRPVFFKDPEGAPAVIKPYTEQADIVKVTEEEAEWLWGVPGDEALEDPEKVGFYILDGVEVNFAAEAEPQRAQ